MGANLPKRMGEVLQHVRRQRDRFKERVASVNKDLIGQSRARVIIVTSQLQHNARGCKKAVTSCACPKQ